MEITSKPSESTAFAKKYRLYDRSGTKKVVADSRIVDEAVADIRGRAEVLKGTMRVQKIKFRNFYTHVRVGDIVRVSAPRHGVPSNLGLDRFIVTSVQSAFDDEESYNIIEAVRYD